MVSIILSLLIILSELATTTIICKSVPTCLSECYYALGIWFTILMYAAGFILLPIALTILPNVTAFFMCGAMLFVGTAANYLDRDVFPTHMASAIISAIAAISVAIQLQPYCLLCLLIALFGLLDKKRDLLYGELGCFACAYLTLILSLM